MEIADDIPTLIQEYPNDTRKVVLSGALRKEIAKALYNKGYRKFGVNASGYLADELIKTTAKEFTKKLYNTLCVERKWEFLFNNSECATFKEVLDKILKEFIGDKE